MDDQLTFADGVLKIAAEAFAQPRIVLQRDDLSRAGLQGFANIGSRPGVAIQYYVALSNAECGPAIQIHPLFGDCDGERTHLPFGDPELAGASLPEFIAFRIRLK